ncbi:hypothetical protein CSHISOI_09073 [Colletotrichum shisoi]|uniref:Uncharacterized protein n=1 Tax=Colletotrichum shisoi TaxID=2078593 RepID=A0A5Q4BHL1_9PEZI|nr:hypothetical protein CSHISOI_09073 [Colletotrichum shisoi]
MSEKNSAAGLEMERRLSANCNAIYTTSQHLNHHYDTFCNMKSSIQIFALVAPADTQVTTDADAESFFIQTNVGWFDGGDSKKREAAKKSEAS